MTMPAAAAVVDERFEQLGLDTIDPSKTNPRTHFVDAYLKQLADSIVEKGVIQPLVVRPRPNGRFEIVVGECRWRAAKSIQLPTVPAVIRAYSDAQALEVQLIENLHRTDLTPLEQAAGYKALMKMDPKKHTIETIASRLGMSPAWVWDRVKLDDLIPDAKQLLEREQIAIGHAIPLARLKPAEQKRVIDPASGGLFENVRASLDFDDRSPRGKYDDLKPVTIRELEAWIARHIRFDVAHAAKAAPLEFGATAVKVEAAQAVPGRGKKVIAITHDRFVQESARDGEERTYGPSSWKRADGREKSKTCDHAVLGVFAVGPQYGEAIDVCVSRDKCDVHWKQERRAKAKNAAARESGGSAAKRATEREAKARVRQSREEAAKDKRRKEWTAAIPAILQALGTAMKTAPLALVGDLVLKEVQEYSGADLRKASEYLSARRTADDYLRLAALTALVGEIDRWNSPADFPKWAKRFGVDTDAILKATKTTATSKAAKAAAAKGTR